MRQIGRKTHQLLIAVIDTGERLVEVLLKPVELGVGTACVEPGVQPTGIQLHRLRGQFAQGAQPALADQRSQQKTQ